MKEKIIYELESLYRSNLRIRAFDFGEGEKSVCIVGSLRGNEVQQTYICSLIVKKLKEYEEKGWIKKGYKITVIPCVNTYSLNQGKRFWPQDDTDINRMFPGYYEGETTQRVAEGVFDAIKDYAFGIQLTSFYIPGAFSTHVRMMHTGVEDLADSRLFGLRYVVVRKPRPYDTTTLNYNWQIWNCKAYSLYTRACETIDETTAREARSSVLRFLYEKGITTVPVLGGFQSEIIEEDRMLSLKCEQAGFMRLLVSVNDEVHKGDVIAKIYDPYDHTVREEIIAPEDGTVFFSHAKSLVYAHTAIVKLKLN